MDEIFESRDEFNVRIRKSLVDWFGTFEDFHEKVSRNVKHGLIRSKIKSRSSPLVSLQIAHDSPSHIPVHVALQSMRNLVEEPLSALPIDFMPLKSISSQEVETAARESSKTGFQREKRKKVFGDEERSSSDSKRRKAENVIKDKEETGIAFSPDSGVQSTETENIDESNSVEAMLSIMTSLEEPTLSPISDSFLRANRSAAGASVEKKTEPPVVSEPETAGNEVKRSNGELLSISKPSLKNHQPTPSFQTESSMSPASTSRETTPVAPPPPHKVAKSPSSSSSSHHRAPSSFQEPATSTAGSLKLRILKPEKIERLLEMAKKNGKIVEEKKEKSNSTPSERSSTPFKKVTSERKEMATTPNTSEFGSSSKKEERSSRSEDLLPPKLQNKTVRSLAKEVTSSKLSPSAPSPRSMSSINTPTSHSRPSSSLSTHDPINTHPSSVEAATTSSAKVASAPFSSSSKPPRWTCQWEHTKLKTIQRVPIMDPTTNPSAPKSKGDFYHMLAKEWKAKADKSKDRVLRPLNYMLSSVFFVLEAITKSDRERTPQARMQCVQIYRDTHELLGVAIFQGIRDTEDAIAAHILPRIKILGQIMLSVMQYQLYIFRSEQAIKNYARLESREVAESIDVRASSTTSEASVSAATNKHMNLGPPSATSANSTPSSVVTHASPWRSSISNCSMTVTMPQVVFDLMKSQVKTANALILASRYWEDSKNLARQVDFGFIKHIETVCGKSVAMDMSFDVLAQFVLTAIGSLKAEYDEEQKLAVKPILAKVKPAMDIAMKTGSFHSVIPDRAQRTSQTTPRLPTPLLTSTPNSSHNHSLSK